MEKAGSASLTGRDVAGHGGLGRRAAGGEHRAAGGSGRRGSRGWGRRTAVSPRAMRAGRPQVAAGRERRRGCYER